MQIEIVTAQLTNGKLWKGEATLGLRFALNSVSMNYPCRFILYNNTAVRNVEFNKHRQVGESGAAAVIFECYSIFGMTKFDLTKPPRRAEYTRLLTQPAKWQPVILQPDIAKIPLTVEARSGGSKHKINFVITLDIDQL